MTLAPLVGSPARRTRTAEQTARKPYDIAVTSILLRCRHIAPDAFVIGSDGEWTHEWQHGSMHWHPAREKDVGPVDIVRLLFRQIETPRHSQLLADVFDGPVSARTARS